MLTRRHRNEPTALEIRIVLVIALDLPTAGLYRIVGCRTHKFDTRGLCVILDTDDSMIELLCMLHIKFISRKQQKKTGHLNPFFNNSK